MREDLDEHIYVEVVEDERHIERLGLPGLNLHVHFDSLVTNDGVNRKAISREAVRSKKNKGRY